MKKIGSGIQFKVYVLNENRVIKKQRTKFERKYLLFFRNLTRWNNHPQNFENSAQIEKITSNSITKLKELNLKKTKFIGNPQFLTNSSYEQDKVTPLKKYLKNKNLSFLEKIEIIDKYILNILETWKNGFSDTNFNLKKSYGITHKKEVILLDLGALSFSKKNLTTIINSKQWLKQEFYLNLKDKELKQYFEEEMKKNITLENLNLYWKDTPSKTK